MKWEIELKESFEKGDYESSISILKKNISDNRNVLNSYINLIYVYIYYIIEVDCFSKTSHIYEDEIKTLFKKLINNKEYNENATFLFYTAYTASAYGEFILNLNRKDLNKMYKKAVKIEPYNLLYKYGYLLCFGTNDDKRRMRLEIAKTLLNDQKYINDIADKSLVGDDLLWLLTSDIKNNIKYDN